MARPKDDKQLIDDLRREAATWFYNSALNDLETLIEAYLRLKGEALERFMRRERSAALTGGVTAP